MHACSVVLTQRRRKWKLAISENKHPSPHFFSKSTYAKDRQKQTTLWQKQLVDVTLTLPFSHTGVTRPGWIASFAMLCWPLTQPPLPAIPSLLLVVTADTSLMWQGLTVRRHWWGCSWWWGVGWGCVPMGPSWPSTWSPSLRLLLKYHTSECSLRKDTLHSSLAVFIAIDYSSRAVAPFSTNST